jgi:brefeldin A-inhibited guanine nucleotide-exchange protein
MCRESFNEPNPNDEIPTIPPPIGSAQNTPALSSQSPTKLPQTVPIPVPDAEALNIPEAVAPETMDETEGTTNSMGRPIPTEELFVKDAFLVFRALCKLSMKPLVTER